MIRVFSKILHVALLLYVSRIQSYLKFMYLFGVMLLIPNSGKCMNVCLLGPGAHIPRMKYF